MKNLALIIVFVFISSRLFSQTLTDTFFLGEHQMQNMELDDAIASFEIVEKGIKNDTSAMDEYIMCLLLKASCYLQLGKIAETEINIRKGDSLALKIYGEKSEAHYSALRCFSTLYWNSGRKEDAAKYTLLLLKAGEDVMGKYNQQHLQDLITNAPCLIEMGNSDYLKSILDDIFDNHKSLIDTLPEINLGLHSVLAKIYKYKKDEIMQIKEYEFLIEHSDFTKSSFQLSTYGLDALTNLANIYAGEGNEAKAIILLENYLPAFSKFKIKGDVLKLTAIYDQIGDLYRGMELPQKSKEYYSSSLKVIEENYGKDDQFYFDEINSIAEIYTELNLYKEADSLYSIKLVWLDKNDSSIKSQVTCLTFLAFNKIQWGHYLEARKICLEVLDKYKLINDKSDFQKRQNLEAIYYIGLTYKNENNFIEAESYYKKAIDYVDKNRKSFDDFTYIQQIKGLEYLYSSFGKVAEAEKCLDLILSNRNKNALQNQKRSELEYNFEAAILAYQLGEEDKFLSLISTFTVNRQHKVD